MRKVILIGFMGAGKSSVGKKLAEMLGMRFVDTDQLIEEQTGRIISDIFAEDGEEFFRDLETDMLRQLQDTEERMVIAVGGGLPVRKINREYMKNMGIVIYLKAGVDTLEARLQGDTSRPKLQGSNLRERIVSLMEAREDHYQEAAGIIYVTDGKNLDEIVCGLKKQISE